MDIELLELQTEYLNDLPEKLDLIYELLISLEKEENIEDTLNNLKGVIHSIKGSSGSYEINFISELCHSFEDEIELLDKGKTKKEVLINCFHYYELLREFMDFYSPGSKEELTQFYDKLSLLGKNKKTKPSKKSAVQTTQTKKILIITDDDFFRDSILLALAKLNTDFSFAKKVESIKKNDHIDYVFLISPGESDLKKLESLPKQVSIISLTTKDMMDSLPSNIPKVIISHHLIKDIRHSYLNLLQKEENPIGKKKINPEKILFVDDDESIHPLVKMAFKTHKDIEINFCHSAKEAQDTLKAFKPDLILLDSMMPDISGKEFKKTLSEDKNLKDIPVIFLTGLDSEKEIESLKKTGAIEVICKPFKIKELAGQVLEIWSKI